MSTRIQRREFLGYVGAAAAAAATAASLTGCDGTDGRSRLRRRTADADWDDIRRRFIADPRYIHLAGLLISTHPRAVRDAIDEHRRGLDLNPGVYVEERNTELEDAARSAAAGYLGARQDDVALTESTTMGIALVCNGVAIRADQEMLTTTHDYYSTRESLRFRSERTGAPLRTVEPFADSATATADEVTDRITAAIQPRTRLLGLTWVHSWTGIKIPIRQIADRVAGLNAQRTAADRVLILLDGVHALGVEDFDVDELGCDFFTAGTHKWLFGPRGSGILWGSPQSQDAVTPTIPTFSNESGWGGRMTPGGFKSFEHTWALTTAFELHDEIGRARITERIRELSRQCKEGLANMAHVRLHTPMDSELSAGIISFDVDGLSGSAVVRRLADQDIIASTAPYERPYARLTPGLLNTPAEIDVALAAIRDLA